jgi:hypothetical protein
VLYWNENKKDEKKLLTQMLSKTVFSWIQERASQCKFIEWKGTDT